MKRYFFFLVALTLLASSCSDEKREDKSAKRTGKGGKTLGGTFRFNESESSHSIFPMELTDATSAHISQQIFEGLVKLDPKELTVVPCIAESWNSNDGKTYTFKLKKNVKFHNSDIFPQGQGRVVSAEDFKYTFEKLATFGPHNNNFGSILKDKVVGANEYYEATKNNQKPASLEGVKVIDANTLQITLVEPYQNFLFSLTNPGASVIPREGFEKHKNKLVVGTGPFMMADDKNPKEKLVLVRNPEYHRFDKDGNQLPYLDSIVVTFINNKKNEIDEFEKDNLHFLWGLNSDAIKNMVEEQISDFNQKPPKKVLYREPEMATQYYAFNTTHKPFDNVKVRQAFSYAINRERIIERVLEGEAFGPGDKGITPPQPFKGYNSASLTGYTFDPEKAKKLLSEAGYPDGKNFPQVKIVLNSGGNKNYQVLQEIQKQLSEVLNITNLDFELLPQKDKLAAEREGRGDIFRAAWIADFPSPENFLSIFYGQTVPDVDTLPSYPNSSRYRNPEFDKLYEAGRRAGTKEEAYRFFLKAEEVMLKDAPAIILWYDENWRVTKSSVQNFYFNPIRYFDFSEVYLQAPILPAEEKKEEKKV